MSSSLNLYKLEKIASYSHKGSAMHLVQREKHEPEACAPLYQVRRRALVRATFLILDWGSEVLVLFHLKRTSGGSERAVVLEPEHALQPQVSLSCDTVSGTALVWGIQGTGYMRQEPCGWLLVLGIVCLATMRLWLFQNANICPPCGLLKPFASQILALPHVKLAFCISYLW